MRAAVARAIAGVVVIVGAVAVVVAILGVTSGSIARGGGGTPGGRGGRVTGTVVVTDGSGATVSPEGALVYVVGFTEAAPDDVPQIVQKQKHFVPDLVAVTAGQKIAFPNADPILHNVFSLSPTRKFDLGSYRKGDSKEKAFPTTGVVDVYCNIHPEMAATILVLPNRRFARVGADGRFAIDGVPPGTWSAFAYTRLAEKPASATVTVTAGGTAAVSFALVRTGDAAHKNKYGERYRDPETYR